MDVIRAVEDLKQVFKSWSDRGFKWRFAESTDDWQFAESTDGPATAEPAEDFRREQNKQND